MRLIAAILPAALAASQVAPANKPAGTSPRPVNCLQSLRFLDRHLKAAHE